MNVGINGLLKTVLMTIIVLLSACGRWSIDSTNNVDHWGGYKRNSIYRVNIDVFLIKKSWLLPGPTLALVPAASVKRGLGRHFYSPYSIEKYRQQMRETGKSDSRVKGIIEKGTKIKVFRLDRQEGWSWWFGRTTTLSVVARIMDGAFANSIVDITDVSIYYKGDNDRFFKYKPEELIFDPRYFNDTE